MSQHVSIKWYGAAATHQARRGAARGLFFGAEHILEQSRRLVPHLTGDLELDSVASVDEGQLKAAVSYGLGVAAAYAVPQHEEMDFHHAPGRQAKYLEQPFNSEADVVNRLIAREIKKEMRS
jgi:hypothetical protein